LGTGLACVELYVLLSSFTSGIGNCKAAFGTRPGDVVGGSMGNNLVAHVAYYFNEILNK